MTTEHESNDWTQDDISNQFEQEQDNQLVQPGVRKFLELYKIDHIQVAESIKGLIKIGTLNPIEAYLSLRRMKAMIEATIEGDKADKEMKELFKDEVRKALDGGKSLDIHGANLSIRATGTNYDYTGCGDPYLNELYKIQEDIKARIKLREDEIKAMLPPDDNKTIGIRTRTLIQEGMPSFTMSDDAFEYTITPPIKRQGESIFCTFKKQK